MRSYACSNPTKVLNYDRLADLTDDMKKRSARLRENLSLPEPEKTDTPPTHSDAIDDAHLKKSIADLHDVIVNFVANPLFKNLGVVDAKVIDAAGENLDDIIGLSEEIKREAKMLGKPQRSKSSRGSVCGLTGADLDPRQSA